MSLVARFRRSEALPYAPTHHVRPSKIVAFFDPTARFLLASAHAPHVEGHQAGDNDELDPKINRCPNSQREKHTAEQGVP